MNFKKMHILLTCNLGASTTMMAKKMEEVVKESKVLKDVDIKVDAEPGDQLNEIVNNYDIVMVAPQMQHKYEYFEKICNNHGKKIVKIRPEDYGSVNAGNIIKTAIIALRED